MTIQKPIEVIQERIPSRDYLPGNSRYPLLIYKQAVLLPDEESAPTLQDWLKQNKWTHAWVDSIYDFHHYHSNTHEVLIILSGDCQVQFGGDQGQIYTVIPGDVIIIPAGVAHKSLKMSKNFRCIGAYPFDIEYDMNYGNAEEYLKACEAVSQVGLPTTDPIFGIQGTLYDYWK
ncbi:cupin domain-containing protein (plasmid) [Legionella sp. D16C41]|uniref:cupin domain-containing protein n=1 Tax=Legionella sp. D16C41 TaxID=3402688 RepID=UPI003AF49125